MLGLWFSNILSSKNVSSEQRRIQIGVCAAKSQPKKEDSVVFFSPFGINLLKFAQHICLFWLIPHETDYFKSYTAISHRYLLTTCHF